MISKELYKLLARDRVRRTPVYDEHGRLTYSEESLVQPGKERILVCLKEPSEKILIK